MAVKRSMIVAAAGILLLGSLALGQPAKVPSTGGVSPHETFSKVIGGNRVTIVYGRPLSRDPKAPDTIRKIWGVLVPWGKVWRLGSDEATLLITQQPIMIGTLEVPAGAHTLFMLPDETGASKLIINNQLGQWGLQYDAKQDLGRVDLKKDAVDKQVDEFTMALDNNPGGGGVIKIIWENTQYSVVFTPKK